MSANLDQFGDDDFLSDDEEIILPATLQNIIDGKELQWVFVGGKGGVGKTTISSCLAIQLSKVRENVLIISTDPAHNLSDAFAQKFSEQPTKVNGYDNLFAMEIEPNVNSDELFGDFIPDQGNLKSMLKDVTSSLPGMDEISSFLEIMKQVKQMKFSVVVFDTAPTGHTLRLLSFPTILDKGVGKLMGANNFGNIMSQMTSMFSNAAVPSPEQIQNQMGQTKQLIDTIVQQFKDPKKTTFVCVCIPEFLSVYETERLVQELAKNGIDTHNIVVNQLVFKSEDCDCKICDSRIKIQKKYLNQIFQLYEDFHIVQMPLLGEEVRGPAALESFGKYLLQPHEKVHLREKKQ